MGHKEVKESHLATGTSDNESEVGQASRRRAAGAGGVPGGSTHIVQASWELGVEPWVQMLEAGAVVFYRMQSSLALLIPFFIPRIFNQLDNGLIFTKGSLGLDLAGTRRSVVLLVQPPNRNVSDNVFTRI